MASYPEVFASQIRALVEPLESYILNQFHGYAHGNFLILGVIAIMWNVKITYNSGFGRFKGFPQK